VNGRSRPGKDGPEEISRAGDSGTERISARVSAVRLIACSILLDPASYGATPDDDLTIRLDAAAAVVTHVGELSFAERLQISRSLPWIDAARRRWSR
jgi:hypothetical protein